MSAQYAGPGSRDVPETRGGHPQMLDDHCEGNFKRAEAEPASLQPSRRAAPERLPHEETEVERARVDEQPLEDVVMTAQMGAAEPAGVVQVGEGALHVFAAPPHEPLPAHTEH